MSNGLSALQAEIARLRALGSGFVREVVPAIAQAVEGELRKQYALGVGPDGERWEPTKTLRRALLKGRSLSVRAMGTVILARLDGHEARHNDGAVRGNVARPVLPTRRIPAAMTRAISQVLGERFAKAMGHGG